MKKLLGLFTVIAMSLTMSVCMTSCGSDDDNGGGGSTTKSIFGIWKESSGDIIIFYSNNTGFVFENEETLSSTYFKYTYNSSNNLLSIDTQAGHFSFTVAIASDGKTLTMEGDKLTRIGDARTAESAEIGTWIGQNGMAAVFTSDGKFYAISEYGEIVEGYDYTANGFSINCVETSTMSLYTSPYAVINDGQVMMLYAPNTKKTLTFTKTATASLPDLTINEWLLNNDSKQKYTFESDGTGKYTQNSMTLSLKYTYDKTNGTLKMDRKNPQTGEYDYILDTTVTPFSYNGLNFLILTNKKDSEINTLYMGSLRK